MFKRSVAEIACMETLLGRPGLKMICAFGSDERFLLRAVDRSLPALAARRFAAVFCRLDVEDQGHGHLFTCGRPDIGFPQWRAATIFREAFSMGLRKTAPDV